MGEMDKMTVKEAIEGFNIAASRDLWMTMQYPVIPVQIVLRTGWKNLDR